MSYTFDTNLYSDLYKDVYGFRPRNTGWNEMSDDEKQTEWNYLIKQLGIVNEEHKQREQNAIAEYEKRINDCMTLGAKDRNQAISWVLDSLNLSETDLMYGATYVCYTLGLPYEMQHQFTDVMREKYPKQCEVF